MKIRLILEHEDLEQKQAPAKDPETGRVPAREPIHKSPGADRSSGRTAQPSDQREDSKNASVSNRRRKGGLRKANPRVGHGLGKSGYRRRSGRIWHDSCFRRTGQCRLTTTRYERTISVSTVKEHATCPFWADYTQTEHTSFSSFFRMWRMRVLPVFFSAFSTTDWRLPMTDVLSMSGMPEGCAVSGKVPKLKI
jgi:hypothetical protein